MNNHSVEFVFIVFSLITQKNHRYLTYKVFKNVIVS